MKQKFPTSQMDQIKSLVFKMKKCVIFFQLKIFFIKFIIIHIVYACIYFTNVCLLLIYYLRRKEIMSQNVFLYFLYNETTI